MFYVYVLPSEADDGLYIGFTTDLRRRIDDHQAGGVLCHIVSWTMAVDLLRGVSRRSGCIGP
jgi:predicted GIY-YIG superfamily endonuclease